MGDEGKRSSPRPRRRQSRVPTGRVERLARIGILAGEVALGGVAERVRRLAGGGENRDRNPLLTSGNADRLAKRLSGLRGAAMKLGQMLSMEGDDLLPAEFSNALSVLRADGDAMPRAQLERVLRRAWGSDWTSRFQEFDFEPVAAASIGQVHRATTDDGRDLALKIQFPGVSGSTDADVDNLASALQLARLLPGRLDLTPLLDEAKRQLRLESDYRREAKQLRRYGELLEGSDIFVVPAVHGDLTTTRVLAMDYLAGVPLEDLCGPDHPQERRDRVGSELLRLLLRELFELRFMQTDPNFANYLWLGGSEQVGLLDLGAAREIPKRITRFYTELTRSAMHGDRAALEEVADGMALLHDGDPPERREAFIDFLEIASEPFRAEGIYDFGASQLPLRIREKATQLAFQHSMLRPPPPEILFIQRKLGGTFLLCARLRARFDVRAIFAEVGIP